MGLVRKNRINNENISSIKDIEEYVNTNYLQVIQNKIHELKLKKQQIEDKIILYNDLNNANNIALNLLLNDSKYTTILNNQRIAEPLINDLNNVLELLATILSYKDILTLNNLNYREDLYGVNKVDIVEGKFFQLQCPNPKTAKGIVNKDYLNKELLKIEQPPKPLQRLKYLTTDAGGNLQWTT